MTTETSEGQSYEKPLPPIIQLTKPFWDGCREGELRIQFCNICDKPWFPPAEACPRCLMNDWEWRAISGRGRVWSWIRMWQRYFPGWSAEEYPYTVALIALEEGPYMYSTLVGIEDSDVSCDLEVEVDFRVVNKEVTLPVFRPSRG